MKIDRFFTRTRAVMLTAAFAVAALTSAPVSAAAPMAKTNAPGFYRIMLGDFEVTALNDGTNDMPWANILKAPPEQTQQTLAKTYLKSPLESSFNGFLVNTGSKLVLIDTGAGTMFGKTLGNLVANLKASGYQPEQVDEIYITHFHTDHIGGLIADGKAVFPNAVLRADKRESDFWLNEANAEKAPEALKGMFKNAKIVTAPYIASGKFQPFTGNSDLVPGIKAVNTIGHTPGHTSYVVESKGQKLVVMGDVLHVASIQFPDPDKGSMFDTDGKAADAERNKILSMAAKDGAILAGAHLPFPGLGHLRADGKGYDWIPVNFTQIH
ncbi:MAG TPA: MBL fold metallo-hydrolase [Magnetospirillaceae bacterium]|nr:MBL fold metallo-hydrolase [Magnetospirillaceae bacterium]